MESMSFLWETVIPFLVVLTILVFVHELGHYWVARRNGVRVEVFSIGFGPELTGWTDSHGTRWKISAVPLGGYVKMFGESETVLEDENVERDMTPAERAVSFHHKSLRQRAAIVFAGPAANYLFAMIVFAILFATIGVPQPLEEEPPAVIGSVFPGSAAAESGFEVGDQVIRIDGENIYLFSDLHRIVRANPGKQMEMTVLRDGQTVAITVTPAAKTETGEGGEEQTVGQLGVGVGGIKFERQNPIQSVWFGIERTFVLTYKILEYVWDVISGRQAADELGGPLRIAQISGQVAQTGLDNLLTFMAVLSVNLGLINLFPIPMLDGGHLAFYAVEAARGRPLGARAQEYGFRIGLALVVALFLFVTWNDLVHLKFFEFITGLFT